MPHSNGKSTRPIIVSLLIFLFGFGTLMTALATATLLFPDSAWNVVWKINPKGHEGFVRMGSWSFLLLLTVGITCAFAMVGLLRRILWGYWLAIVLIAFNLFGDLFNVFTLKDYRALLGVPVAILILWALRQSAVGAYFEPKLK